MIKTHYRRSENDVATLCGMWGRQYVQTRVGHEVTCAPCRKKMAKAGIATEPPAVVRTIRLPLAKDTTDKECGQCPNRARQHPNDWSLTCFAFRRLLPDRKRLPECIEAEKC